MKILFISGFVPYPPVSGNLQRNFNLIREISRHHEIDLVTLTQRGLHPDPRMLEEAMVVLRKFCREIQVFKLATDYCRARWYFYLFANIFSLRPLTVWKFSSPQMRKTLKEMIAKNNYDLVHIDSSDVAQYQACIGKIPAVLNHHNVESQLLLRRSASSTNLFKKLYLHLQGRKLRSYERRIIGKFSLNLAVSENDAGELKRIDREANVEIVSNGTDIEYFHPQAAPEEKRIVFAGPLSWYPNSDAMIYLCGEIYPQIKRDHPDAQLDIIGHSAPAILKDFAAKDPSLHLHGFQRDIRPLLARAAVYVVPIRVGGGTRLKILDALASGKAVVSTSVGCEGLKLRDGEEILIADDPRQFAQAVGRLFDDQNLRRKLSQNGLILVEQKYSWQIIGRHLEELYKIAAG